MTKQYVLVSLGVDINLASITFLGVSGLVGLLVYLIVSN